MLVRTYLALVIGGLAIWVSTPAGAQTLAPYEIVGLGIPVPLTDQPGNPARGKQVVRDADKATCLICHSMPIPDEPDQGNIGPSLAGVGSRYTSDELRLRVVNPKAIYPDTIMPAYYELDGLNRVLEVYRDQPIYTPQQVEDVVSYLASLKDPRN